MTPEERREMNRLCRLIQDEKDHSKFMEHLADLLALLQKKERRIATSTPEQPQSD
jgi:beta-phosphoglucomutase-like phosphatase (HAD superfamily)